MALVAFSFIAFAGSDALSLFLATFSFTVLFALSPVAFTGSEIEGLLDCLVTPEPMVAPAIPALLLISFFNDVVHTCSERLVEPSLQMNLPLSQRSTPPLLPEQG